MTQRRFAARALLVSLVLAAGLGCGFVQDLVSGSPEPVVEETSRNDLAVCDAYQNLVDAWPADSNAVKSAGSAQEIYRAIEEAGAALVTAGGSADDPELGQAGVDVGESALRAIKMDEEARKIGFVPFFDEDWIGGEGLSQLCSEMGRPISKP